MNEDNINIVKRVFLGVSIFINLIILIYAIKKIGYTAEFAGALISLWHKFIVISMGTALTSICYLILELICKHMSKYRIFTSIIVVVAIGIIYYFACIPIAKPQTYNYNKDDVTENQLKELNGMIARGDKILSKSDNLINNPTIKLEDSTAIINYFSNFLDYPFYLYSDSIKKDYSSKFYDFFNRRLMEQPYGKIQLISDTIETNKYRQAIKNKLSIDLFLYSPKREKLFIVITYDVGKEPIEANALVLIGERYDNKILLYKYKGFRNDYGVVNKKYALYEIITGFENEDIYNNKDNVSPLDKSFWDGYWYEKVKINNTEKYRYQLDDYAYKWNEKKQFNERVTEEIKTIITIEK